MYRVFPLFPLLLHLCFFDFTFPALHINLPCHPLELGWKWAWPTHSIPLPSLPTRPHRSLYPHPPPCFISWGAEPGKTRSWSLLPFVVQTVEVLSPVPWCHSFPLLPCISGTCISLWPCSKISLTLTLQYHYPSIKCNSLKCNAKMMLLRREVFVSFTAECKLSLFFSCRLGGKFQAIMMASGGRGWW